MSNEMEPNPLEVQPDAAAPAGGLDVPVKLFSTALELGRRVTVDVTSQAMQISRDVVEGARQGRPPAELASTVIDGWLGVLRDTIGVAQELQVPGADFAETVTEQAQTLARPITSRLPDSVNSFVPGGSVKDVRAQLRKQGRALLERSTLLDDPEEHPAFRRILGDLSPDEARIIRMLALKGPQPLVDVIEVNPIRGLSREVVHHASWVGLEAGCIRPELGHVYLDNLQRLGLVHIRDFRVAPEQAYELLYAQPEIDELPPPAGFLVKNKMLDKGVELSEFGEQLYEMCFADDAAPA